jgi:hypothetical protein
MILDIGPFPPLLLKRIVKKKFIDCFIAKFEIFTCIPEKRVTK